MGRNNERISGCVAVPFWLLQQAGNVLFRWQSDAEIHGAVDKMQGRREEIFHRLEDLPPTSATLSERRALEHEDGQLSKDIEQLGG